MTNDSVDLFGNESAVFQGTFVISDPTSEFKKEYDYKGAMYFTVAVVLVYGLSIVGLIASHMKGSQGITDEEIQIQLYMKKNDKANQKEERQKLQTLQKNLGFVGYNGKGTETTSIHFVNEKSSRDTSQDRRSVGPAISVPSPSDCEIIFPHQQSHSGTVSIPTADYETPALHNSYSYINEKGQYKIRSTSESDTEQPCTDLYPPTKASHIHVTDCPTQFKHGVSKFHGDLRPNAGDISWHGPINMWVFPDISEEYKKTCQKNSIMTDNNNAPKKVNTPEELSNSGIAIKKSDDVFMLNFQTKYPNERFLLHKKERLL